MQKRLQVSGTIEFPVGAELPALGERVTVAQFTGEVVSLGERLVVREGIQEVVHTVKVELPEDAHIVAVDGEITTGLFDATPED